MNEEEMMLVSVRMVREAIRLEVQREVEQWSNTLSAEDRKILEDTFTQVRWQKWRNPHLEPEPKGAPQQ
jgi:hypothetical protein